MLQAASHDPTVSEQLSQLASLHDEVIKKISGHNDAISDRIDAWVWIYHLKIAPPD